MTEVTDKLDGIIWQNGIAIQIDLAILQQLRNLNRGEQQTMTVMEDLTAAVATIRTSNGEIKSAIDGLVSRLAGNPDTAALEAVVTDLKDLSNQLESSKSAIDLIDPAVGGGVGLAAGTTPDGTGIGSAPVAGPLVDADGKTVNASNQLVNTSGELVDADGNVLPLGADPVLGTVAATETTPVIL